METKNSDDNKVIKHDEKKKKLEDYKCLGYSSTTNSHPYLTESERKDLDEIFWID